MKSVFIFIFIFLFPLNTFGERVYIFIPTEHKPVSVEKKFSENLNGVGVRCFGSIIDFKKAVEEDTPDAVITKPQVIPFLSNYTIAMNGTVNGKTTESFFLLSTGDPLSLNSLDEKNIGILDFLGRKNIKTFTTTLFDSTPKLKRVKKIADLLPLLSMNLVDGVVVSATQAIYIKSRSNLTFTEIKCRKNQEIAALALSKENKAIIEMVKKLPADLTEMIGVDGWN